MQSYLKTRPIWMQLLLFIGMAMGISLVITLISSPVIKSLTGINPLEVQTVVRLDATNPGIVLFLRLLILIQFIGFLVVPSFLFAYFSDPQPIEYIGLKKPIKPVYWILGIASLIIALPIVEYLGMLNREINFGNLQQWVENMENEAMQQVKVLLSQQGIGQLITNIIFIALFAGIGEELFFRGVLQRLFIKAFKNAWAGIFVTAILFAAIHLQFFGFLPRFFLGILLGAVYWYSGSLLTSMLAHFLYNGFLVTLAYFQPQIIDNTKATMFSGSMQITMALVSTALVVLLVWVMKKNSTTRYDDVYKNDDIPKHQDLSF